jgi:hypothetical protein
MWYFSKRSSSALGEVMDQACQQHGNTVNMRVLFEDRVRRICVHKVFPFILQSDVDHRTGVYQSEGCTPTNRS